MKNMIIANNGSIQSISGIPDDIKAIYKTVWEISQKKVLDLAADRGAFICQSQSLNVHLQSPTNGQLTSMHFYGWKKGLKTGMYYLRTRPAAQAIQFTVDASYLKKAQEAKTSTPKKPQPASNTAPNVSLSPVVAKVSISTPVTPTPPSSTVSTTSETTISTASTDIATSDGKEVDPEYAEALRRQKEKELEQEKLMCSLENKEACVMCSG